MVTNRHLFIASLVRATAIAAALLLVTILTVTRSQAAFSDTTNNGVNNFATGTVTLTDDDTGLLMFNATGMAPGTPLVECIEVTYSGSTVPVPVRMYAATTGTLDTYLDTTIEIGTGGGFGNCGAFVPSSTVYNDTLANYAATHFDWTLGLPALTAASNPTVQTFRFTIAVQDNDAAQGLTSTADFIWQAQA